MGEMKAFDCFQCPACSPHQKAVAIDGNRKLYRFRKQEGNTDKALFHGVFVAPDDEVANFVDTIRAVTTHKSGRGSCGNTAARETSQKSRARLDEEGLEIAVCRHGFLQGALNMCRGEIFAYPLFLHRKLRADFVCTDIACKYWPYLCRVGDARADIKELSEKTKPFLSVMHAKAHSLKCEIKWGGMNQIGAGKTLGEEVEQVNSYMSRVGFTTKHMTKAG
ncbi:hypothetical protein ACEWY4_015255 [Coilia grayii]|uniref:Uncharacterized protein n=1 Tax=Coilia grayii TaxID=363190 RepID=A0ABD1JPM6_9TELE